MKRALAISLLVHGVFLVYAATRPPRPLLPQDHPIELALFEIFNPPPPPPAPEPEAPKQAVKPKQPLVAMKTPPVQPVEEPQENPEPQPPVEDVPRADAPLRVPGVTSGGNGLVLPLAMLTIDAGVPVQEARRGLHAPEIPKDLVGVTAKEALGRGRVARGMVHPYYVQLGKALIKQWDADRAVSSTGLKGFIEQAAENNRVWNGIWQERAVQYAKSGTPFAADQIPDTPMRPFNERMNPYGGNAVDQQARRELQKQMNDAFRSTKRATIRVVQNREGKLTKVELVEPSNDEHVDQEALTDVRAAAEKLPVPPPEALEGGKEELSSLWSFELVISITPPVPTFTFEFDEVLGFIDARMPLDRRIYKKVKLVSVE